MNGLDWNLMVDVHAAHGGPCPISAGLSPLTRVGPDPGGRVARWGGRHWGEVLHRWASGAPAAQREMPGGRRTTTHVLDAVRRPKKRAAPRHAAKSAPFAGWI